MTWRCTLRLLPSRVRLLYWYSGAWSCCDVGEQARPEAIGHPIVIGSTVLDAVPRREHPCGAANEIAARELRVQPRGIASCGWTAETPHAAAVRTHATTRSHPGAHRSRARSHLMLLPISIVFHDSLGILAESALKTWMTLNHPI